MTPGISDYELSRSEPPRSGDESGSRRRVWIGAILLVAAAALAVYVYAVFGRRTPAPAASAANAVKTTEQTIRPLGADAEPIAVPPLAESDPIVRDLVRKITSHPAVLAWLATDGLIRNFTVVVSNVADGATPARHLRVLRPASAFRVVQRDSEVVIDSSSYERYDGLAAAAASIDPTGASRVYATLKPRIGEAYAELGGQPSSFDRALERAIVALLQTPVVEGPIRVAPKGVGYAFADPSLEGLTGAQKQLLRTGPRNVRTFQSALRRLALALGIPAERLNAKSQ
jgi:DUF3014 family protein